MESQRDKAFQKHRSNPPEFFNSYKKKLSIKRSFRLIVGKIVFSQLLLVLNTYC
jgi:hypothetical protein